LNATLDYPQVMNQTLDWALRITHATIGLVCAVIETDSGEQGLRFLTHKGYDEEDLKRYSHENVWPLHQGLLGHTVSLGETLLEQNVQNNPHYVELVPGMQAQLTVPIKREERVIGAIVMESKEAESFTDDNVAFVQRLVDHAAIAIDNARLFQQVQQANAAKTQFVSFVSHELKQPMASIKSYCELLQKNESAVLADKQLEFVNYIQSSADRMNHLIQDLLDISRIESGQMRLTMEAVNPGDIANLAIQNFQHMLDSKKQRLHVDIAPDLPIVKADKGRLSQVLDNLVSNAHKYTPEGGSIYIRVSASTQKGRDVVCWSVTDTGIGMSQEELDSIFTKYFRAERAIVRNNPGTGLGLVISQYIVELHGGTMSVESAYQKGSTFSFTVPVVKP
jgi:signal transduction histidine kinase